MNTLEDLDRVIGAFEKHYTKIYPSGARYPEAGYQITEIYAEAVALKQKPVIPTYPLSGKEPPAEASKGQRQAYMDGQWQTFNIWEMDHLKAGNRVDGPAIIEHPMTTLVIPPQDYIEMDEHLFIRYKRK